MQPRVSHSVLFGYSPFTFQGAHKIASGKIVSFFPDAATICQVLGWDAPMKASLVVVLVAAVLPFTVLCAPADGAHHFERPPDAMNYFLCTTLLLCIYNPNGTALLYNKMKLTAQHVLQTPA